MGCMFNNYKGICDLYDGNIEMNGVDENGHCICDEDPDPTILCEDYVNDDENWDNEDDLDLENEEE